VSNRRHAQRVNWKDKGFTARHAICSTLCMSNVARSMAPSHDSRVNMVIYAAMAYMRMGGYDSLFGYDTEYHVALDRIESRLNRRSK
jgi:hypothetical protein